MPAGGARWLEPSPWPRRWASSSHRSQSIVRFGYRFFRDATKRVVDRRRGRGPNRPQFAPFDAAFGKSPILKLLVRFPPPSLGNRLQPDECWALATYRTPSGGGHGQEEAVMGFSGNRQRCDPIRPPYVIEQSATIRRARTRRLDHHDKRNLLRCGKVHPFVPTARVQCSFLLEHQRHPVFAAVGKRERRTRKHLGHHSRRSVPPNQPPPQVRPRQPTRSSCSRGCSLARQVAQKLQRGSAEGKCGTHGKWPWRAEVSSATGGMSHRAGNDDRPRIDCRSIFPKLQRFEFANAALQEKPLKAVIEKVPDLVGRQDRRLTAAAHAERSIARRVGRLIGFWRRTLARRPRLVGFLRCLSRRDQLERGGGRRQHGLRSRGGGVGDPFQNGGGNR